MFKFATSVVILLMGWNVSADSPSPPAPQTVPAPTNDRSILFGLRCNPPKAVDEDFCKKLANAIAFGNTADGSCSKEIENLKDVHDKFDEACKDASLSSDCITAFRDCDKNPGGSTRSSAPRDKNAPLDVEAEKARDSKCPAMASGDLKDLEDKLDKEQEKLDKLKDEVPKLQSDQAQATKDAQKDIADKKKEYAQNQADYSKELAQITKDKDAKDKEIQQQLNGMNAELKKTDDAMRQLEIQKMDAKVKMLDAKTQIELNCHATASSQVSALQAEIIPLLKTKSYNVGSMSALMKNVGLTDRQTWQRVAYQRYLWCMQSKPTTDSQASANRIYQLALAQANTSKQSLVQQEGQLKQQIAQIANANGCGQSQGALNGETAACQNIRQAQSDAATAQSSYNAKQNALNQDITSAQQAAAQEWQSKNQAITSKNQQIKDEETRLGNLQDVLQAKYAAGGHGNSDSKSLSAAFTAFNRLKNQADQVVNCIQTEKGKDDPDACDHDSNCQSAKSLLTSMNARVSDAHTQDPFSSSRNIASDDPAPTPTPAPTPDTSSPASPPPSAPREQ